MVIHRRNLLLLLMAACMAPLGYAAIRSGAPTAAREVKVGAQLRACLLQGGGSLPNIGSGFPISDLLVTFQGNDRSALNFHRLSPDQSGVRNVGLEGYIGVLADLLLKDTEFQGRFALNDSPDEGRINLYIVSCDLSDIIPGFKSSSCTYIGFFNAIVCRSAYFKEKFFEIDETDRIYALTVLRVDSNVEIGPDSAFALEKAISALKQSIFTWIIGHEIGHAVLHKSYVSRSGNDLHWNYSYTIHEQEADRYVASKIAETPQLLTNSGVHVTIGEIIEQEYRKELKQVHPDISEEVTHTRFMPSVIPLTLHPLPGEIPLLMRAVKMRRALLDAGIFQDPYGYFSVVENNIYVESVASLERLKSALAIILGVLVLALMTLLLWNKLSSRLSGRV